MSVEDIANMKHHITESSIGINVLQIAAFSTYSEDDWCAFESGECQWSEGDQELFKALYPNGYTDFEAW